MDGDGTGLFVCVDVIAGQRLHVAVKDQADQFTSSVDNRASGVAADDICRAHKIERR